MSSLLLLSNSTLPGTPFFQWPRPFVQEFLRNVTGELAFVPFAGVTISFDEYTGKVAEVFREMGYVVNGVHRADDPAALIRSASGIVVGGGNTFALLARLTGRGLMDIISETVHKGVPYVGWSAGTNLACSTIMTTNDMPIVEVPSFEALNLIPFQVNPHYHELKFESVGGETRPDRINEFLSLNPDKKVVGLPEGMLLERRGDTLWLKGNGNARLYEANRRPGDLTAGDVSHLLS